MIITMIVTLSCDHEPLTLVTYLRLFLRVKALSSQGEEVGEEAEEEEEGEEEEEEEEGGFTWLHIMHKILLIDFLI